MFAEADDGVERGVEMEFVAEGFGREVERVAEFVFGAAERAVEAEGDGLVGDELEVFEYRASRVEPSSVPRGTRQTVRSLPSDSPAPMK